MHFSFLFAFVFLILSESVSGMHRLVLGAQQGRIGAMFSNFVMIGMRHCSYSQNNNPYKVLGISEQASLSDAKAAYHALVKSNHPDVGGSHEEFVNIQNAWEQIKSGVFSENQDFSGGSNQQNASSYKTTNDYRTWEEYPSRKSTIKKEELPVLGLIFGLLFYIGYNTSYVKVYQNDQLILKKSDWSFLKLATLSAMALAASYRLYSELSRPSFEDLVDKYLLIQQEQDKAIVVIRFQEALKKHGYVSSKDQKRAEEVLREFGFFVG